MIDLHAHTNESDGTLTPSELVRLAVQSGVEALAVTDHDTFEGYEKSTLPASESGLELIRGIELNSRSDRAGDRTRWVHVLAYFPSGDAGPAFMDWLQSQKQDRRDRNTRLTERLQEQGVDITLAEVEGRGRSLAGRPHFARLLLDKGYVASLDEAFRRYIGEDAPAFVERQSHTTAEVIQIIRRGSGIPVVAHPVRVGLAHDGTERDWLLSLKDQGLLGLEVYHSDHDAALQAYYSRLAAELDLLPTGGSDFHGSVKPDIALGSGRRGNVTVPYAFLTALKEFAPRKA